MWIHRTGPLRAVWLTSPETRRPTTGLTATETFRINSHRRSLNRAEDPRPRITGNLRDGSSCDPQFDDVPAGTGRFPGRLGLAAGGPAVAGDGGELKEDEEIKLLQKLVKQRKDSLEIFQQQKRDDLAKKEQEEIAIIEKFLPQQLSPEELKQALQKIISEAGAAGPADLGKVMGIASKQFAGKADGKTISSLAKELLAK